MLVEVTVENVSLLKKFILSMGNSNESFRYYNNRTINVIENHLSTVLLILNDEPIGYGHLDQDKDKVWVGIAISQNYTGKGFGKLIMEYIIAQAKKLNLKEIFLSVDKENSAAIILYKKFGFLQIKQENNILYFVSNLNL